MRDAERTRKPGLALLLASLLAAGARAQPLLQLEQVAAGLERPLAAVATRDGSGRLFLVEQAGTVRLLAGGELRDEPFLDLAGRVSCCGERGLLGLAFHPRFADNRRLFVAYTDLDGDSVIAELTTVGPPGDPDVRADPASEREILSIAQPFANHNSGHLEFGPDGMLYIGAGDGGGGGDTQNNAQRLETVLGKILRIDVDAAFPYAIPADNPFVGTPGARGEIWVYGLRNPWRFSFDRRTGDLLIGDVGQARQEEIDHLPAAAGGGHNLGWRHKEGEACFEPPTGCEGEDLVDPVLVYGHDEGCSVTGGFRYRGPGDALLERMYVYGDFCSGRIWGGVAGGSGSWRARQLLVSGLSISSFGEDDRGRLYVVDYRGGAVYRLTGRPLLADGFESGDASAWSRRRGGVSVVSPGLAGSGFALEVPVDGTDRRSFVRSNDPRNEDTFAACFRIDPADADLAGGAIEILRLRGGGAPLRLRLSEDGSAFRATLEVRESAGGFMPVGDARLRSGGAAELCVDWFRATGPGAADGSAALRKNGRLRALATGLDNHRFRVGAALLGLPRGSAGARSGTFRIDDYVSTP